MNRGEENYYLAEECIFRSPQLSGIWQEEGVFFGGFVVGFWGVWGLFFCLWSVIK